MGITLSWYNTEKTIILWLHEGRVSWEYIRQKQDELFAMLDTVDHAVDLIAYSPHTNVPPNAIPNLKRLIDRVHPNEGYKVVVRAGNFLRSLFVMVSRFNREESGRWYFVDTLEQADVLLVSLRGGQPVRNGA